MNGHRFQIEYGASALEDLDGLPARERAQVLRKIERLQLGLQGDIKRLHEAEAMYRLRMGNYRVLFDVGGGVIVMSLFSSFGSIVVPAGAQKPIYQRNLATWRFSEK
jgi:mRNA-degrading endonuclease RelE of RelBE toxin-antitoxin system